VSLEICLLATAVARPDAGLPDNARKSGQPVEANAAANRKQKAQADHPSRSLATAGRATLNRRRPDVKPDKWRRAPVIGRALLQALMQAGWVLHRSGPI
jgi:hypothetical protein